jgi:phage terminase large subunit-like protein
MNLHKPYSEKSLRAALRDHKRLALSDPCYFGIYYLGLEYHHCQHEWTKHFQKSRFFHAAPRDHGKSVIYSFLLPMWQLCRNPNIRIVLVSKTAELSMRFIGAIQREIETNKKIRGDFGHLKPKDPPPLRWNSRQLYCRRTKNIREPSIRALSVLGSCTGLRSDLTILDDPVDSSMCRTSGMREKVWQWFLSELTPILEPEGQQLVIGTRKHFDDLYSRLMDNPAYQTLIEKAIVDEEKRQTLMPKKWSYARLVQDRKELGSVIFNREKQNEVIDEETALFQLSWLQACRDSSLCMGQKPKGLTAVYQGIDLAMVTSRKKAEEKDSDYTVILTLGLKEDGTRIVLDYFRQRGLTPDGVTRAIVREAQKWKPFRIMMENNLFQKIYELELIRKTDLPIRGHTTTRKKADPYEGVPSLSTLFENRKILLPTGDPESREKTELMIQEFHGLGVEKHDDLVMALWLANRAIPQDYGENAVDLFEPHELFISIAQK